MTGPRVLAAVAALLSAVAALGEEPVSREPTATPGAFPWRFELKHTMTDRPSPDVSTRTTLRVEKLLDAVVGLVRVDLPFVDGLTTFKGETTGDGPGDLKARVQSRAFAAGSTRITGYFEMGFPTANPESLGSGKYRLAPGVQAEVPVTWLAGPRRKVAFIPKVQQWVGVAGDPDRRDIDYTAIELEVEARWTRGIFLSVNPKPVVDWTQDGETAAVLEVQPTWVLSRAWRAWLNWGFRLWGPRLPTTYDVQIEVGVRYTL